MSSSGFLPSMSGMSSTDMLKLMTQMGKSMDSYTSASQHGQKRKFCAAFVALTFY